MFKKRASEVPAQLRIDSRLFADSPSSPLFLRDTEKGEREGLNALVMDDYQKHPPGKDGAGRLELHIWSQQCWTRIRDQLVTSTPARVHVWEMLQRHAFDGPPVAIRDLMRGLLELRAKRPTLMEQLEKLDIIEQAFRAAEAAPDDVA